MSVLSQYTWYVVRGDDTSRVFIYKDGVGDVVNLTGYTAVLEYTRAGVTDEVTGTVDGANGKVTVSIGNAVTEEWSSNPTFKLRLTSGGGVVTTILLGEFEVIQ